MSTTEADKAAFEDEVVESGQRMLLFNVIPSWMISFVGHVALIVLLAILVMPKREEITTALEASAAPSESIESIELDSADFDESSEEDLSESEFEDVEPIEVETLTELEAVDTLETTEFVSAEEIIFDESDFGELGAVSEEGGELSARSEDSRAKALKEYGGSDASEEAVQLALKWIVNHQQADGGWDLDHRIGSGSHRDSPDPGDLKDARIAATALAILPLLGNGQTHKVGFYKDNVRAGLEFLKAQAKPGGRGISFYEKGTGKMYSHGLAAIVFCEAFAMTKDPQLAPFAQGAIWFIEDAQDPSGGGWRYKPRDRGDTSVVGWQVMAMKSAKLSGLNINPLTWRRVNKFLDDISNASGSLYGYDTPPTSRNKSRLGQTSIGLLCRMYMGWDKDTPGLKDGVDWIGERGPDLIKGSKQSADIYYNYYATQVMKQYGGQQWKQWNGKMRDNLVSIQSKEGNTAGSWFFHAPGSKRHASERGGRLYTTALACMTLEVYYRYLPIYTDKSVSDDFKLE